MNKLANKLVLSQFIKRAADEKPYSSTEPSFVDRLVTGAPVVGKDGVDPLGGGLANNVAREAEVLGGAGGGSLLYPRLATLAGGILGAGAGYGGAKLADASDNDKVLSAILGGLAGSLAGRYTGVGMRNKHLEKKNPGFTTSDVTPWAVGQRDIGSLLGGLGGGIGGGLAGAGTGAGLAALAALVTGNDVGTTAGLGAGVGGALGAGVGALLGRPKGEEIADELRHSREAKAMKKKASLADWIDEYNDNKSSMPETMSALAGAGSTAVGGLAGLNALKKRLMRNPEFAVAMNTVANRFVDKYDQYEKKHLNKGRSTLSSFIHALNNTENAAHRHLRDSLANDNSKAARLYKFLSKNRKWGIPATLAGGALTGLGIHNMID